MEFWHNSFIGGIALQSDSSKAISSLSHNNDKDNRLEAIHSLLTIVETADELIFVSHVYLILTPLQPTTKTAHYSHIFRIFSETGRISMSVLTDSI